MDGFSATLLLFLFFISYVFLTYVKMFKERAKLPPGPIPLPFIGNLLQIDTNDIVKSFMELKEKYGDVFTFYMGPNPGVVICGYDAMKESLIDESDTFGDRGDYPVFLHYNQGHDFGFSNGEQWKKLRRFALVTLRNFGMGKRSVEERIQEEADFLIKEFRKTKGAPTDLTEYFSNSVANVICSIVFGSRFDYEDQRLLNINNSIYRNFVIMSNTWGTLFNMYPKVMTYIPGPHKELYKNFKIMEDITLESMKYHEETLDPNCPRDYIDCFLYKMMQEKDHLDSAFYTRSLIVTVQNLLIGGIETINTTLRYGTLILMKYPEITERIQEEIDRVMGRDRIPSIEDRGTYITPFLTSVHYDPTQFEEPYTFNPNHFLDEKGHFKKNDALMPFSAGKRICPGQSLARMELFIYFTIMLQKFTLMPLIDRDEINLRPIKTGLASVPMDYECCLIPR
ncbi:cytochrome P450 2F3-like isoform 2-T2 [Discoglossus pictus]